MVIRVLRAVGRFFLPADTSLPKRYWRLLWIAGALRLLVFIPLALAAMIPYLLCRAFVSGADALGERCGSFYATCHNHDLWRSGWKVPQQRVPAPELSEEWKTSA